MANPVPAAAAENPVCPICLDDLLPGALISVLNCNHTYHQACFQPWLENHRTCPLDKERVTSVNGIAFTPRNPDVIAFQELYPEGVEVQLLELSQLINFLLRPLSSLFLSLERGN